MLSLESVPAADCFKQAALSNMYMQTVRSKATVLATRHLGPIIEELAAQAKQGELDAIKTVLNITGLINSRGGTAVQVNNYIGEQPKRKTLREVLVEDGEIIDGQLRTVSSESDTGDTTETFSDCEEVLS